MKKIDYLLLVIACFATSFPIYASGQINLGFGVTPSATTNITGSKLAMTAYHDSRLSTGTYKNLNAAQFFITYDQDLLSFFGFRAGISSKIIKKSTDSRNIYNRDDGNFPYDINVFVADFDIKLKFNNFYLALGLNYPLSYTIDDGGSRREEGEVGLQGALGLVIYETWGFELFYSEIKGRYIHETSGTTLDKAYFVTALVGVSTYYSISL